MESTEKGMMLSELIKKLEFFLKENCDQNVFLQGLEYGEEYHQPVFDVSSRSYTDGTKYILIEGCY